MCFTEDPGKAVRLGEFKVGLPRTMWGYSEETLVNFAQPDICLDVKNSEDDNGAKVCNLKSQGKTF